MVPILRLVHPAPTVAVVTLSAALAAILASQSGPISIVRLALTTTAVLGSQILTGALNDWADRDRDQLAHRAKPIAEGRVSAGAALAVAAFGVAVQVAASIPLGALAFLLGAAASASAVAYNLWVSRTPLSVLPYLVSFGLLPLWIAACMDVSLDRVAAAPLLVPTWPTRCVTSTPMHASALGTWPRCSVASAPSGSPSRSPWRSASASARASSPAAVLTPRRRFLAWRAWEPLLRVSPVRRASGPGC
jgi:hypothetical protein